MAAVLEDQKKRPKAEDWKNDESVEIKNDVLHEYARGQDQDRRELEKVREEAKM